MIEPGRGDESIQMIETATSSPLPIGGVMDPRPTVAARLALLPLLLLIGCAGASPREVTTADGFRMLDVGGVAIAGQPSPDQLAELSRQGYRTVIDIRRPGEIDWDEARVVGEASMRYARVPITPQTIEVGVLDRLRTLLDDSPRPILFHCGSGNRAALVWGILEAGERPKEEILEIARRAGLKAGLEPMLESWIDRQEAGAGRLR
jgi:uncharacterized protein (TIGR01244 family)